MSDLNLFLKIHFGSVEHLNKSNNKIKIDVEKFNQVLAEYRRAPAITKRRIYLETMEKLFQKFDNVTIVDPKVKGLLPVYGKQLEGK